MLPLNIQYLPSSAIDKERWNECIQQAYHRNYDAFSWYLDTVCPTWGALIINDFQAVFPIPYKKKAGFQIVYQPFFVQQLGIFSQQPLTKEEQTQIFAAIPPQFRLGRLQLNSSNVVDNQWKTVMNINHVLNLSDDYPTLRAAYSENTKRNLKKAERAGLTCRESTDCEPIIAFFSRYKAPNLPSIPASLYDTLRKLYEMLKNRQNAAILNAYTADNQQCASILLFHYRERIVYLFSGATPEAYQNGAQFFLVDEVIKRYAKTGYYLDFEGSNDQNLARFYKSFGAEVQPYPVLFFERFFSPVVKILQKLHKI